MKQIFFFLLLLNVVFLLWETTMGRHPSAGRGRELELAAGEKLETILLVGEAASTLDKTEVKTPRVESVAE